jgi:hypothetical protein
MQRKPRYRADIRRSVAAATIRTAVPVHSADDRGLNFPSRIDGRLRFAACAEWHYVTVFLIVTALVNIALGYGLALYLGPPAWPTLRRKAAGPPVEEPLVEDDEELTVIVGPKPTQAPVSGAAPSHAPEATVASPAAPAAATPITPGALAETAAAANAAPELEEHVLAGIEEFRNQLAQMKAQPEAAPSPTAAAAAAMV